MWWATIDILPSWPVNIGQRCGYAATSIHFGKQGEKNKMQILEEHAAPGLSVKTKAIELISRPRVLNISSELK